VSSNSSKSTTPDPSRGKMLELTHDSNRVLTVLRSDDVTFVNKLRENEGLLPFPPESVVVEFNFRKSNPATESPRNNESGFYLLTATEFGQTDLTLTVRIVADKGDVSSTKTLTPASSSSSSLTPSPPQPFSPSPLSSTHIGRYRRSPCPLRPFLRPKILRSLLRRRSSRRGHHPKLRFSNRGFNNMPTNYGTGGGGHSS
jgi:hypothetical protein